MSGERKGKKAAPGRGKARKRTRSGRGASHALGVVIFSVSCTAALLLLYFILLVDKVQVEGSSLVSAESILSSSGIHAGQHMFLIDEKGAKSAVLTNPYLDSFEIVRNYPDTVILRVVERVPRAIIADSAGDSVLIDDKGNVLSIGTQPDDTLVLVYGMGNAGYTLGQSINTGTDFQGTALVSILQAIEQAGLTGEVQSVNMANALSIELFMRAGYLAKLGQPDGLEGKLHNLSTVLKELEAQGLKGGTIYLAARGGPVYSPDEAQTTLTTPLPGEPEQTPEGGEPSPTPAGSAEPSPTPNGDDPFSG